MAVQYYYMAAFMCYNSRWPLMIHRYYLSPLTAMPCHVYQCMHRLCRDQLARVHIQSLAVIHSAV